MNYSANKSKNSTILVYPANGYIGHQICKELAHESEHNHGNKMEVKEVLAVCCGKGGMYEKLKEMGKPIKTIVLEDASRMSEWKKEMKDRKCDAMMLCAENAPHHKTGMARGESEREHLKNFTESMENAIEMTRLMSCKTVAISTAFAADESKYRVWNHTYKAMEKACKKHLKGNCVTLFHNMPFELLYFSREEIMRENTLSWPVAEDAKFCPMALTDFVRCYICALHKMMKSKTMNSDYKKFHVTGREKLTPGEMMDMISDSFEMEVQYNEVDRKKWRRRMEESGKLSPLDISLAEEAFEMMKKGDLRKCTDEFKKLADHKPMKCEDWLEENRENFEDSY